MTLIIIHVTHENQENAEKITNHLLSKKLIACANFFPIKSSYWWKGKIEDSNEVITLLKTKKENWEKVKSEILKIHPYETPCIMKLNTEANQDYEDWINNVTI